MSINESSATALVRFTGLGIICFNDNDRRGEIAVIRDNKHVLTIKIQQPMFQNQSESDVIVYQDIASWDNLPASGVQIEISAEGNTSTNSYEIYQPDRFERLGDSDINDFRWIVDMNDLHGNVVLEPTGEPQYPISKIFVSNALFYTHKLDTDLLFEKLSTDASGFVAPAEMFGNVAETIGMKVDGDEVTFTLRVGENVETQTLQRVEGLPFRIEIMNMDHTEDPVYSDMADYYGFLASPDGTKYDLSPILDPGAGEGEGGSVNQKKFCHPVAASHLGSIDEL